MKILLSVFILLIGTHSNASFLEAFQVELGTQLPTQLGVRGRGYITPEFYFVGGLGYLPSFYTSMAESMSLNAKKGSKPIIRETLANSFVVDIRAGYYWHSEYPLFIEVGYAMITGGSGELNSEEVYDLDTFFNDGGSAYSYPVTSKVHALTVNLAYPYHASDRITLIFELGFTKPVSSTNTFDGAIAFNDYAISEFEKEMEKVWSDVILVNLGLYAAIDF